MILPEGATIQTGADSAVDLQVNGHPSAVRVMADTTMILKTMKTFGSGGGARTETRLDLEVGTLLGSLRKISTNSIYEVSTPRGVTRISGGDFVVQVVPQTNGPPKVTFTCVSGQLVCFANIKFIGQLTPVPVKKTLSSGQLWSPPEIVSGISPSPLDLRGLPEILRLFETNRPGSPIKVP
jgi:hypothetical protein